MVPWETLVPRAMGMFTSPDGGVACNLKTAAPANSSVTMPIPRIVLVSLRFIYASLAFDQSRSREQQWNRSCSIGRYNQKREGAPKTVIEFEIIFGLGCLA